MIACYDLARCPPTYDAVAFLALAEQERLRRGAGHINLHILPGPAGGFRKDSLWPRSVEERVALREQVLVPLCRLLPSVRSVEVHRDRPGMLSGSYGWGEYLVGLPAIVRALQQGSRPLRSSGRSCAPPPEGGYITFTLREAVHHPLRNSRVDEWVLAGQELIDRGYRIAMIRDTARGGIPLGGVIECAAGPSADLETRASVYAGATLNVGISNGPMWMSIFMGAPTLMLRPTTNAAGGCYDDSFYRQCGVPRGGQLPTSPPHQRLVWEEDTRENIVRAVEDMLLTVE